MLTQWMDGWLAGWLAGWVGGWVGGWVIQEGNRADTRIGMIGNGIPPTLVLYPIYLKENTISRNVQAFCAELRPLCYREP